MISGRANMCCMLVMGRRYPWVSMISMGMIHFHRTITVVAWANTAQSHVPSHGYIVVSIDIH